MLDYSRTGSVLITYTSETASPAATLPSFVIGLLVATHQKYGEDALSVLNIHQVILRTYIRAQRRTSTLWLAHHPIYAASFGVL